MKKLLKVHKKKINIISLLLLAVILLGFLLRLLGINFGLPESMYVDSGHIINPSKKIAYNILHGELDIDTESYLYPALFYNLLATEFVAYGFLYGTFAEGKNFTQKIDTLFTDESQNYKFHLLARYSSAVAGTLTIFFVFLLGIYAYNDKRIGLIASIFLAFMYLHVKDSKYPMTDAVMCLFTTIALIFITKLILQGRRKDYILSGLFIGLATSVKWLPGTLLLPFMMAIIIRFIHSRRKNVFSKSFYLNTVLGFLFIFLGFVIGTPQFITHFQDYAGRFIQTGKTHFVTKSEKSRGRKAKLGQVQQGYFDLLFSNTPNWNEPLCLNSLKGAMDLPLLLLTLVGLLYALYKGLTLALKSEEAGIDLAFAVYVIVYYVMEANPGGVRVVRYFYAFLPLYCVIASRVLVAGVDYLKYSSKTKIIILTVLTLCFVFPTGARAFRYSYLQSHTDTRTYAIKWIHKNIPRGSTILMPGLYHPKIEYQKYKTLFYSKSMIKKCILSIDVLKHNKIGYVVTSSYLSDRYFHRETIKEYYEVAGCFKNLINSLEKEGKLIKEFKSNLWDKPGPTINIYKILY